MYTEQSELRTSLLPKSHDSRRSEPYKVSWTPNRNPLSEIGSKEGVGGTLLEFVQVGSE